MRNDLPDRPLTVAFTWAGYYFRINRIPGKPKPNPEEGARPYVGRSAQEARTGGFFGLNLRVQTAPANCTGV